MGVAATTTEAAMSAIQESLVQLRVSLSRIAPRQDQMLMNLKKTTAALTPTASATPTFVPGRVPEQRTIKPLSPSLLSSVQVIGSSAPRVDSVLAPTMPTSCSTFGLDVNGGSSHAAIRFPSCCNTEGVVLALLDPSTDKFVQPCDPIKFDMPRSVTCSMQCYHEDTSLQKSVFTREASLSHSPTPLLLDGDVFSPAPPVTTVPVGFDISSTVTPHVVDGIVDEVFTDIGGSSLFAELELDPADEVFNNSPLMDMVWDKELVGCMVTHIGGSSLFLDHSLGAKQELEGKVHTHLDRAGCVVGLVSLVKVKLQQPWSRERKQHGMNSLILLLPWDRGKQEVLVHDLCLQLLHAGEDTMPTLPWNPGVCCLPQIVARNIQYVLVLIGNVHVGLNQITPWDRKVFSPGSNGQQQIMDVFHYIDIPYDLNMPEMILHAELCAHWDPGILKLISQATLHHLIHGFCMRNHRINIVDASYKSYGCLSNYFPVHKHIPTSPLVVLCQAAFKTLARDMEMDRYNPAKKNMPIIFFDVQTVASIGLETSTSVQLTEGDNVTMQHLGLMLFGNNQQAFTHCLTNCQQCMRGGAILMAQINMSKRVSTRSFHPRNEGMEKLLEECHDMMAILLQPEDHKLQVFIGVMALETPWNPHVHNQLIGEGGRLKVPLPQCSEVMIIAWKGGNLSSASFSWRHLSWRSANSRIVWLSQVQQEQYKWCEFFSLIQIASQLQFKQWDPGVLKILVLPLTPRTRNVCRWALLPGRRYPCRISRYSLLRPACAIAWGQAMFSGGGNVTSAPNSTSCLMDLGCGLTGMGLCRDVGAITEEQHLPERGSNKKKLNKSELLCPRSSLPSPTSLVAALHKQQLLRWPLSTSSVILLLTSR